MKLRIIAALLTCFACTGALADVNLAAICKDAVTPTDTVCSSLVYDVPKPSDIVKGSGGYFAQWSLFVGPAAVAVVCPVETARGSVVCASAPITVPASAVSTGTPVPSGSVLLSWQLETSGDPATSVWLYSGVKGGTLGKIKQVSLPASSALIPGYTVAGVYTFGVTAANAAGESAMTTIDYTIAAPLKVPSKPASLSIKSVSLQ